MCGRFAQRTDPKRVAKWFGVEDVPELEPRYNIAPTQEILGVRETEDGREMAFYKWGLIPSWAEDTSMGARLINARSETVREKPAFRHAFKQRHCIIPADGYYEWQKTGGRKQPYYFTMHDERPFGFAGLWDRWKITEGEVIETCTILTTETNDNARELHDRMPVILHPEDYDLWLDEDVRKLDLLKELFRPYPSQEMLTYPVSALVNNVRPDGAELIKKLINSY